MTIATTLLSDIATSDVTLTALNLFLDAAIKGSVILMTAGLLTFMLRRASATVRHMIWGFALCSLLLLPALTSVLPNWQWAILPDATWMEPAPVAEAPPAPEWSPALADAQIPEAPPPPAPADAPAPVATDGTPLANVPPAPIPATLNARATGWMVVTKGWIQQTWIGVLSTVKAYFASPNIFTYGLLLALFIWLAGFAFVLIRLLFGILSLAWVSRRAVALQDGDWYRLSVQIARSYGIRRRVRLRKSYQIRMPLTWGAWEPVVLLPNDAETWSEERRRVVLLHELAHIKRWDWLTQSMAQLACAFHWFNPMAWVALRQLRKEHEHACDDYVLMAGAKASTYAEHLLAIARTFWTARLMAPMAVAMARKSKSELEGRMVAILNPKQRRCMLQRTKLMVGGLVVAAIVIPLAAMQLRPADAQTDQTSEPEETDLVALSLTHSTYIKGEAYVSVGDEDRMCKEVNETYDLDAQGRVHLENINGDVQIVPWNKDKVRVEANICAYDRERIDDVTIDIDAGQQAITIKTKYPKNYWKRFDDSAWRKREPASVDYVVTVPRSARLNKIELVNGNLELSNLTNTVKAELVNGDLNVEKLTGDVNLETVNGKINADFSQPAHAVDLSTVNGVVTVKLPYDADARINASTVHGSIRNDFGFRTKRGRYVGRRLRGELGDGTMPVRLNTVNGSIRIRRADGKRSYREQDDEGGRAEVLKRKEILLAELNHSDYRKRQKAIEALGRQHDPRALYPLMERLEDRDHRVREKAAWALGELGDQRAVEALIDALEDREHQVRVQVAQSLGQIQDLRAQGALQVALQDDHRTVRGEAKRALRQLNQNRNWDKNKYKHNYKDKNKNKDKSKYKHTDRDEDWDEDWDEDEDCDENCNHDEDHDHAIHIQIGDCDEDCAGVQGTREFAQIAHALGTAATDAGLNTARHKIESLVDALEDLDIDVSVDMDDVQWNFQMESEDADALGDWLNQAVTDLSDKILDGVDFEEMARGARFESKEALLEAQQEMVEALGELPDGAGISHLKRIAETHSNAKVRQTAIKTLRNMNRREARRALKGLGG